MLLNRKKYRFALKLISLWESGNILSSEEASRLKESIEVSSFDWKKLAKYSFWFAGISLAIAVFALFMDDLIIALIMKILKLPYSVRAFLFGIVSAGFYAWGFCRKKRNPGRQLSGEFLLFVGAVFTAVTVYLLGETFKIPDERYPIIILASATVYLLVGALFPSGVMWMTGLVSLCSWFGAETGYMSGWGAYFLGMNYPLRFVMIGFIITALSFLMTKGRFAGLRKTTYIIGLLNLFIALWLMSIFGNYGGASGYHDASEAELLLWSLLFGAVSVCAIIFGLKRDDEPARGFGLTFLMINLYTRYFEYFWKSTHKAIFFAILGLSFWILGRYSEKAWNRLKSGFMDDREEE